MQASLLYTEITHDQDWTSKHQRPGRISRRVPTWLLLVVATPRSVHLQFGCPPTHHSPLHPPLDASMQRSDAAPRARLPSPVFKAPVCPRMFKPNPVRRSEAGRRKLAEEEQRLAEERHKRRVAACLEGYHDSHTRGNCPYLSLKTTGSRRPKRRRLTGREEGHGDSLTRDNRQTLPNEKTDGCRPKPRHSTGPSRKRTCRKRRSK